MTARLKPRYPATLFRHRHRYGERYCGHCGRRLTPKVKTGGRKPTLETAQAFAKRKYCDYSCRSLAMMAARAAQKPAPSEPPTLTDPAYGGLPAPLEVVEGVASETEAWRPGELQVGTLFVDWIPEARKDPALNRPVRPVKLPSTTPPQLPPVPPPSLQAKLPDPRPQAAPYTVTEGEVIERGDFGTCPNEACGDRLDPFGKCRTCLLETKGRGRQRAKLGEA